MNKRIGSVFGSKAGLVTPIEDGLRMRLNETKIDGSVSDKVKSAILKQRGVDQKDSEPGLGDYINYLSKELNAANDTVDELIDTISDKETKIIEIEALLNNFGKSIASLTTEKKNLEEKIIALRKQGKAQKALLAEELLEKERALFAINDKLATKQREANGLQKDLAAVQKEVKDLRGQLTDTQSRTDNLRQQLSAAQQEAKAIDKKNKELKVQAKQLQQEVKSIGSRWFSRGRWTVIALQATIIAVYCLSCFIQGELEAARIRNA